MAKPKALYIHIPFCTAICGYCDFTRFGYSSNLADRYLMRLKEDLEKVEKVETIYIGGGTPTALSVDQLHFLFETLELLFQTAQEITIEANPDSVSDEKIDLMVQYGINRVSLGVQSTDDIMLASIGRTHSYETARDALSRLRTKGIDNVSVDLIYGLPYQTVDDVKTDVKNILQLKPVHLSLYALTIEPNSAFGRQKVKPAPPDVETEMYLSILKMLQNEGFHHYEISNFAKPGYESKHNQHYWAYDDFYGIGIGASGKENHIRYTNTVNLNEYLNKTTQYQERIELSLEDEMFESVMMSLRTSRGINKHEFKDRFNIPFDDVYYDKVKIFIDQKWLETNEHFIYASEKGRLMLNEILIELM